MSYKKEFTLLSVKLITVVLLSIAVLVVEAWK